MFRHRFEGHSRYVRSSWFGRKWFRRGLLLLVLPIGAVACHGRGHHHDNLTEAELKERAADHVDDALDWLDGTDTQKQQVKQVVDTTIPDMMSFREEQRALRTEFQKELKAPTVNAAALEDLRVRFMKLADAATARGLRAFTDIARVLTPQQRQKAVEKWQKFSG
jgi:Spy/CpxP family protein refolding chaperone